MTTITATPNPADGSVKITITKTEEIPELIRADGNGTNFVRARSGTFPSTGTSGTINLTDYDACFNGPISYRAGTAAPIWCQFPAGMKPRLTVPEKAPAAALWVDEVTDYSYSRETGGTVHEIIGRSGVVVVKASMKARRGSLEIIVDTWEQIAALEAALSLGHTMLYRQSSARGMDFYFWPLSFDTAPEADGAWKMSVNYVKTDNPAGPRPPYGAWTFGVLADAPYATMRSVAMNNESFMTLAVQKETT